MSPLFRTLRIRLVLSLVVLMTAFGCSSPLSNDDASPTPGHTPTVETQPTMRIVTPTPYTPPAVATGTGVSQPEQNPETYVVVEGDSLYSIALRFGVDLNALIELNSLTDPNDITIGQELRIPPRP